MYPTARGRRRRAQGKSNARRRGEGPSIGHQEEILCKEEGGRQNAANDTRSPSEANQSHDERWGKKK